MNDLRAQNGKMRAFFYDLTFWRGEERESNRSGTGPGWEGNFFIPNTATFNTGRRDS